MYQVLVIDDDKLARKGLISLIPWEKYGMEVAGDVAKLAMDFLAEHQVDLAVVDLTMPVLSGLEFICECRAREISMDYIVLSAHEDFTYVQKALRLGVIDYISKLQLEPEECGEVFLRAAEHIRKRKEKEQQMQAGGRINRKKTETVADQEEKEQWRKLWEETASLISGRQFRPVRNRNTGTQCRHCRKFRMPLAFSWRSRNMKICRSRKN